MQRQARRVQTAAGRRAAGSQARRTHWLSVSSRMEPMAAGHSSIAEPFKPRQTSQAEQAAPRQPTGFILSRRARGATCSTTADSLAPRPRGASTQQQPYSAPAARKSSTRPPAGSQATSSSMHRSTPPNSRSARTSRATSSWEPMPIPPSPSPEPPRALTARW